MRTFDIIFTLDRGTSIKREKQNKIIFSSTLFDTLGSIFYTGERVMAFRYALD